MLRHAIAAIALATAVIPSAALADEAPSQDDLPYEVDVIGRRAESERLARPGHTSIMRPDDATRFDSRALLERETSLALPETGRINASGFALPRIRGQDARLTEIYLDDLLLQDPYGGLPLVDELDLRAFGELVLHQGMTPPELPTTSPIGALQYRYRAVTERRMTFGGNVGRPHGVSTWALGEYERAGQFTFRGYAREHRTDGAYRYYDDNATPYNARDDRHAIRTGNDRRSRQAMPHFTYSSGRDEFRGFVLWSASETGLPGYRGDDRADESSTANLGALRWTRRFTNEVDAGLGAAVTEDGRRTRDPDGSVLGPRGNTRFKASTRRADARLGWRTDSAAIATVVVANVEGSRSRVRTGSAATVTGEAGGSATTLDREALVGHVGAAAAIGAHRVFTVEGKISARQHHDDFPERFQVDVLDAPTATSRNTIARGAGLALGWRATPVAVYVQLAQHERPPSLLEEFGDGGLVRGQPEVRPERLRHGEFGATVRGAAGSWRAGAALFEDRVDDRIVFVPALGASVRALNLAHTRTRGAELTGDTSFGPGNFTRLTAGYTRLDPADLTLASRTRLLPAVPEHVGLLALDQRIAMLTLRWGARYQSRVYRDVDNSIAVPAYTIHDASLDSRWPTSFGVIDVGLSVLNVFDVNRLPIEAPRTSTSRGYTSYSDLDGYPLPGRQWRMSVAAAF